MTTRTPSPTFGRRPFLKLSLFGASAAMLRGLGLSLAPAEARAAEADLSRATLCTSVCCFCSVGCGLLVWTDPETGRTLNIEGNPEHPINGGTLCPKGASIWQLAEQTNRVTDVMYRAPGSSEWEIKSWDWALPRIAERIRETRDAAFQQTDAEGRTVNRALNFTSLGSAALDNEEGWMLQAFMRSLGTPYVESHARI